MGSHVPGGDDDVHCDDGGELNFATELRLGVCMCMVSGLQWQTDEEDGDGRGGLR